jgi:hypothetical protein
MDHFIGHVVRGGRHRRYERFTEHSVLALWWISISRGRTTIIAIQRHPAQSLAHSRAGAGTSVRLAGISAQATALSLGRERGQIRNQLSAMI